METLSFTQEYFLCAINSKGNIPLLKDVEIPVCFIAGGIMELLNHGYIARVEKDKLVADQTWDDGLPYLKPLYDAIASSKKAKDAKNFTLAFWESNKQRDRLISAFGVSLLEAGCVDELTNQGLTKKKTKYVPKEKAVTKIIEKIRAEFLEDGALTEETIYLAVLLEKSGLICDFFSKVEQGKLKERIKEVRDSEAYALVKKIRDYIESLIVIFIASSAH